MNRFEEQIVHLEKQIREAKESIQWINGEGNGVRFSDSSGDITDAVVQKHQEIISSSEYLLSAYRRLAETN